MASKICLNNLSLYSEALKYGKMCISEREKEKDNEKVKLSTIYYVLGICYSKYADSQKYASEKEELKREAIKAFTKCDELAPYHYLNLYYLGREYAELDHPEKALAYLRKSLKFEKLINYFDLFSERIFMLL